MTSNSPPTVNAAQPGSGAARQAGSAVGVIMAVIIARAFGAPDILALVLLAAAGVLVHAGYHTVPPRLRRTSLLLFGITLVLLPVARDPLVAIERGILVSGLMLAMISSVLLLAPCALKNPRVQRVGITLRGQPARRRYLSFTSVSQLFSGMLGMAGAYIMLSMAAPDTEARGDKTEAVIGVTRGFAVAGFWSPVYGNMVILLALYPTLHWSEVFPIGVALAQLTLIVGLVLKRLQKARTPASAPEAEEGNRSVGELLREGMPLLLPMLAFMGLLLATSTGLGIMTSATVVLLAPGLAVLFHLASGAPGRRVANVRAGIGESMAGYPRLASEALVFMAAGCAGSVMADAFPAHWAQQIGSALDSLPFFGLAFLLLSIMTLATIGVHSVLSAVFLASTITPELLNLPPVAHMTALLTGWGLASVLTPFSVLSLTAARYAGTSLYQISLGRNWLFVLINTLVVCTVLTGVTLMLR